MDRAAAGHRSAIVWLALVALALFLPGFFSLQPMDRDEPRFAQASKQMLETGDYVAIRLQDEARNKKPVGIYWLQAGTVAAAEALGSARRAADDLALQAAGARRCDSQRPFDLLGGARLRLAPHRLPRRAAVCFDDPDRRRGAARQDRRGGDGDGRGGHGGPRPGLSRSARTSRRDRRRSHSGRIAEIRLAVSVLGGARRRHSRQGTDHAHGSGLGGDRLGGEGPHPGAGSRGSGRSRVFALTLAMVAPWFVLIMITTGGAFLTDSVGGDMLAKVASGQELHGAPPGSYLAAFLATGWPMAPFAILAVPFAWKLRREPAIAFLLAWIVPGLARLRSRSDQTAALCPAALSGDRDPDGGRDRARRTGARSSLGAMGDAARPGPRARPAGRRRSRCSRPRHDAGLALFRLSSASAVAGLSLECLFLAFGGRRRTNPARWWPAPCCWHSSSMSCPSAVS